MLGKACRLLGCRIKGLIYTTPGAAIADARDMTYRDCIVRPVNPYYFNSQVESGITGTVPGIF